MITSLQDKYKKNRNSSINLYHFTEKYKNFLPKEKKKKKERKNVPLKLTICTLHGNADQRGIPFGPIYILCGRWGAQLSSRAPRFHAGMDDNIDVNQGGNFGPVYCTLSHTVCMT